MVTIKNKRVAAIATVIGILFVVWVCSFTIMNGVSQDAAKLLDEDASRFLKQDFTATPENFFSCADSFFEIPTRFYFGRTEAYYHCDKRIENQKAADIFGDIPLTSCQKENFFEIWQSSCEEKPCLRTKQEEFALR